MIRYRDTDADYVRTPDLRIRHSRTQVAEPASFRHVHDTMELILYARADHDVFVHDRQFTVRDGDLVFIGSHVIHRMDYRPTDEYDRYVAYVGRSRIEPVLDALGLPGLLDRLAARTPPRVHPARKDYLQLRGWMEEMVGGTRPEAGEAGQARALAAAALALVRLDELLAEQAAQPGTQARRGKTDRLVSDIIAYIDTHHAGAIRLEDLQRRFYADRCHISHAFRQQTGFGVVEYIQYRRVAEAQKMLQSTTRSILDICMDCGFNNAQHFYRVFRRVTGTTPDRWRHAGRTRPTEAAT